MSVAYNAVLTSDLDKGTTAGDADGPPQWVDELGREVPTFVSERLDLVAKYHGR